LLVGAHNYRTDVNGESVNKFFQPIIEYLNESLDEKTVSIEYDIRRNKSLTYKDGEDLIFIKDFTYFFFAKRKITQYLRARKKESLVGLESFLSEINSSLSFRLESRSFLADLERKTDLILSYSDVFMFIFS